MAVLRARKRTVQFSLLRSPLFWGILTLLGLGGILFLPLPGLVLVAGLGFPLALRYTPRRLLHLLPFWAFLVLPAAYGHPGRAFEVALRSLNSLIFLSSLFALLGESGVHRLLLRLPGPLGFVLLLILKHFRVFLGALRRNSMAMKLRAPRRSLPLWGGVAVVLFRKAERRGERIARAARFRNLPWSW